MKLCEEFINTIKKTIESPKIILDIGSRDLEQSIELSQAFPKAKIIAFEPLLTQYEICYEKSKNYPNIEVYNIALSNSNGICDFWVVDGNIGASSLLKPIKIPYGNWENNSWNNIKVETKTLDVFCEEMNINAIDCIWMDVQGAELKVLEGSRNILKTIKCMHIEACPTPYYVGHSDFEQLNQYIKSFGFDVSFKSMGHVWGEGDLMCVKKSKYNDFTLVIQGPIDDITRLDALSSIEYYQSMFFEIILSTYTEHLAENWEIQKFCKDNNIKIVHQSINEGLNDLSFNDFDNSHDFHDDCGVAFQTITSLHGFRHVKTRYLVKHRIDEKYSNLNLLLDKFLNDTNKLVTGGTFFGQKVYFEYCAADHLMVGKTEKLIETFQRTLDMINSGVLDNGPEIMYTKNFIRSHGEIPTTENHDNLMRKYVDFLPDKYMEPFVIRANHWNQVWNDSDSLGEERNSFETVDDMINSDRVVLNRFWRN